MSWPTIIRLVNSERSHANDGAEIRETWYVEPYDSQTAFVAAMLGRVDSVNPNWVNNGTKNPNITYPARHYLYDWCYATACESVPLDPKQTSYSGPVNLQPAGGKGVGAGQGSTLNNQLYRLKTAVQSYRGFNVGGHDAGIENAPAQSLDPTYSVDKIAVSQDNKTFSAGSFICVTYKPLIGIPVYASPARGAVPNFDGVNWKFTTRQRTNHVNKGLALVCPPGALANLPMGGLTDIVKFLAMLMPDAGISPVFKEEYDEVTLERRMLLPNFAFTKLSQFVGKTNYGTIGFGAGATNPNGFLQGTMKYTGADKNWVQVPQVDTDGEPSGYNTWLNLRLRFDWRVIGQSGKPTLVDDGGLPVDGLPIYDGTMAGGGLNGIFANPKQIKGPITWNHVLAYPGILHTPDQLAWYRAKFATGLLPINIYDPFPMASNFDRIFNEHF